MTAVVRIFRVAAMHDLTVRLRLTEHQLARWCALKGEEWLQAFVPPILTLMAADIM